MKFIISTLPMIIGIEIYRFFAVGQVMFHIGSFALYLVSVILAYLISFRVNLCFGFMAFYVTLLLRSNYFTFYDAFQYMLPNIIINFMPNISVTGHLGGFIVGVLFAILIRFF